jgi:hypothetical protein
MARDQLKLMEAAIVLAEELNFSRAARRLHISQPALTKQVAELENRLGVQLFSRDKQTVNLTDAGRAYIEEARLCVFHSKRATHAVHSAAREIESVLSIGRSPYIDPFLISTLLTMSAEDDLAHQQQLKLDDLGEREWVLYERHVHPPLYELILDLSKKRNVHPTKIHHVVAAEEALPFITQSRAIAFMVKSGALRLTKTACSRSTRGIAIRPLNEDALLIKTCIASRADNGSKLASELVRSFMRKLGQFAETKQLVLPIGA